MPDINLANNFDIAIITPSRQAADIGCLGGVLACNWKGVSKFRFFA